MVDHEASDVMSGCCSPGRNKQNHSANNKSSVELIYMGCWTKNRGIYPPKMDGENHGKPPKKIDDLGGNQKPPIFWVDTHIFLLLRKPMASQTPIWSLWEFGMLFNLQPCGNPPSEKKTSIHLMGSESSKLDSKHPRGGNIHGKNVC